MVLHNCRNAQQWYCICTERGETFYIPRVYIIERTAHLRSHSSGTVYVQSVVKLSTFQECISLRGRRTCVHTAVVLYMYRAW